MSVPAPGPSGAAGPVGPVGPGDRWTRSGPFAPPRLLMGGDWSPEQWSPETWDEDIELLREARATTVTLGVFSWSALEPVEGAFETGWLDAVIERITAAGIGFVLATPTASPPPWFTVAHPDAMPVGPDGVRLTHGSRDTYAVSAPAYRQAARRIARRLAERYGDHPGLQAWHVHNEYGTLDHGPHAAAAFRRWLQRRYGDLDTLNAAWTTAFWSQRYGSFEEIEPPRATQYRHNPAQLIDFRRSSSDEMLAAMAEQRDEIRAAGSLAPVTTNVMLPTWNHLEQWSWAEQQDVVSLDHYLDTTGPDAEAHVAYGADLARSWSGGPWVLMEQDATGIRVGDRTYAKEPDRMLRNSLGYIARGSQSSLFFQWRASVGGSEQWHGALVPHAGGTSRAFAAVRELGAVLERLAPVAALPAEGPLVAARVGILWHADGWWALETPDLPHDGIRYGDEARATHRSFWRAGIPVEFVRPGAATDHLDLLVVPCQLPMDDAQVAWLTAYVEAGGELLVTFASGLADEHLRVAPGGYPGRLRELLGVRGEEIRPLEPGREVLLDDGTPVGEWTELLEVDGAGGAGGTGGTEVLARYTHGVLAGRPALTRARRGAGGARYLSARPTQEGRDALLVGLAAELGIGPTLPGAAARGLEAVRRRGDGTDHLFLLHHGDEPVVVRAAATDLVGGDSATAGLRIAPGGAAVLALAPGQEAELMAALHAGPDGED